MIDATNKLAPVLRVQDKAGETCSLQELVIRVRDDLRHAPELTEVCAAYVNLRAVSSVIEDQLKELDKLTRYLGEKVIPDMFEEKRVDGIVVAGHRVGLAARVYASIKADDRADAYQWLKDNGYADSVVETVHAQRLASIAKEVLGGDVDGLHELPEDMFKVETRRAARVTRVA